MRPLILSFLSLVSVALCQYILQDDYIAATFAEEFNFFTNNDPTNGYVNYVSQDDAVASGLLRTLPDGSIYMGVDHTNIASGRGRNSVRVETKRVYNHGLFILDLAHMPGGQCGTWPAWFFTGPDPAVISEVDIIEAINTDTTIVTSLKTNQECTIDQQVMTGRLETTNCNVNTGGVVGCSIDSVNPSTYGTGFNALGGGVYVTEWTSAAITIWYFPRNAIPTDITAGTPNPNLWGVPLAKFVTSCELDSIIKDQNFIINIALCGDYAGNPFYWDNNPTCFSQAPTCNEFVRDNPGAFVDTYWQINELKVYQGSAPIVSTTSSVLPTTSSSSLTTSADSSTTSSDFQTTSSTSLTTSTPTLTTSSDLSPSSTTTLTSSSDLSTTMGTSAITSVDISTTSGTSLTSSSLIGPIDFSTLSTTSSSTTDASTTTFDTATTSLLPTSQSSAILPVSGLSSSTSTSASTMDMNSVTTASSSVTSIETISSSSTLTTSRSSVISPIIGESSTTSNGDGSTISPVIPTSTGSGTTSLETASTSFTQSTSRSSAISAISGASSTTARSADSTTTTIANRSSTTSKTVAIPSGSNGWANGEIAYNSSTITLTGSWIEPCSTGLTTKTTVLVATHCGCTEEPLPSFSLTTTTIICPTDWPITTPFVVVKPVPPSPTGHQQSVTGGHAGNTATVTGSSGAPTRTVLVPVSVVPLAPGEVISEVVSRVSSDSSKATVTGPSGAPTQTVLVPVTVVPLTPEEVKSQVLSQASAGSVSTISGTASILRASDVATAGSSSTPQSNVPKGSGDTEKDGPQTSSGTQNSGEQSTNTNGNSVDSAGNNGSSDVDGTEFGAPTSSAWVATYTGAANALVAGVMVSISVAMIAAMLLEMAAA